MLEDGDAAEEIVLAIRQAPRRVVIPTTAYLRICGRIELDREVPNGPRPDLSVAEHWGALTTPLRLAGAPAMRRSVAGRFPVLDALAAVMPWGAALIDDVARQLSIQLALGRPWFKLEPMLLVGPPGIGKTWLARRLAGALQIETAVLELGNTSDDRLLSGTARGYTNTLPGWPLVVMASTMTANPLLVLDEIDKAGGSSRNGHAHRALLSMLEPASAKAWYDQCLLTPCNLSQASWVGCPNSLEPIPAALRSRFRIIAMPQLEPEHFDDVLASVVAEVAAAWEMPPAMLPDLPERALGALREHFGRDRSVRALARHARAMIGAALADHRPRRH